MELFLPSIFVLLISALFAFAIIPSFGPRWLAIISLIALIAVAYHNATMFEAEWRASTWQQNLTSVAPWIVLAFAILLMLGFLSTAYSFARGTLGTGNVGSPTNLPLETAPTILETATNMAQKSLEALPAILPAAGAAAANVQGAPPAIAPVPAQAPTNPLTAVVNTGLNAIKKNLLPAPIGPAAAVAPATVTAPAPKGLPFSPSSL
jgi:hypothetical protein